MIWKDVYEFENSYEISDKGIVRSKERYVKTRGNGKRLINSQVVKQQTNRGNSLPLFLF